jgi:hypothetical protein
MRDRLLALLAGLCFPLASAGAEPAALPDQASAVMQAVYQDMIRDVPGLSGPFDDAIFCLEGPDRSDPPAVMMSLLTASDGRIRAASACLIEPDEPYRRALERRTGASAIILQIESVRCSDAEHCSVTCGYYQKSLSGSSNTFEVEKQGGAWVVVSRNLIWIS